MNFSKIGFGGYRIDDRVKEHYDSLSKALLNGINLIDTSANYTDGRSEILVGNVLSDLLNAGKIKREDVTLVTKGGYVQGQNYKFALKKKENGNPFSGVVEYEEGLWHCISPDYLEDQINRQLFRLCQNSDDGYIDVYLLHNPEYYLNLADKKHSGINIARDEYYIRIKKAFEFLEEKVKQGKILYYGISSNTFPSKPTKYDFTSLEKILEINESLGANGHFKFIELPFNLIESGALFEKNQFAETKTVLEIAKENGINVLVNRPLNSITTKGLMRLADFEISEFSEKELANKLNLVLTLEDDILKKKLANIIIHESDLLVLKSLFTFGKSFEESWKSFGSIEHLNDFIEHHISTRIDYLMDYFEDNISDDYVIESFNKYIQGIFSVINYISAFYKNKAGKRSKYLHSIINELCDSKYHNYSLSQKALLLLNSIDGVNCTLVGTRKQVYVDDVVKVNNNEKIENAREIFIKIRDELSNADIFKASI
jgi:aryl-alcohol dehydrogenase-like predicted oxidoreductase